MTSLGRCFAVWILMVPSAFAIAQATWMETMGFHHADTVQTSTATTDGGLLVAGQLFSETTNSYDIWLIKMSPTGLVEWQKSYGDSGYDYPHSIHQTKDGGFILGAMHQEDMWIVKTDSTGSIQWQRSIDNDDLEACKEVIQLKDGSYIATGYTYSPNTFLSDLLIVKFSVDGAVQWQKLYDRSETDQGSTIRETSDGNFVIAGMTTFADSRGHDLLLIKVNPKGTLVWQKTFDVGPGDLPVSMAASADHTLVIAGQYGDFDDDFWVLKVHENGQLLWQKVYTTPSADDAVTIRTTPDKGYLLAGITATTSPELEPYDGSILKLDASGNIEWQRTFGGINFDSFSTVEMLPNGEFIIAGHTNSFASMGQTDLWFLRLDEKGVLASACSDLLISNSDLIAEDSPHNETTLTGELQDFNWLPLLTTSIPVDSTAMPFHDLFCDDFEDSILPEDWTYELPRWTEENGVLKASSGKKTRAVADPAFSGCEICSIETQVRVGSGGHVWIFGWYVDEENTVELLIRERADKWVLRQRVHGVVVTKRKFHAPIEPSENYQVTIVFDGEKFRLLLDHFPVLEMPKFNTSFPEGTIAFQVRRNTAAFEKISVRGPH